METSKIESQNIRGTKRLLQGLVISNKMQKTIVVKVDRKVRHVSYGKYITISKKYKAHDEKGDAKIGDRVEIIETKPISRDKRWALRRIVMRSTLAGEYQGKQEV